MEAQGKTSWTTWGFLRLEEWWELGKWTGGVKRVPGRDHISRPNSKWQTLFSGSWKKLVMNRATKKLEKNVGTWKRRSLYRVQTTTWYLVLGTLFILVRPQFPHVELAHIITAKINLSSDKYYKLYYWSCCYQYAKT